MKSKIAQNLSYRARLSGKNLGVTMQLPSKFSDLVSSKSIYVLVIQEKKFWKFGLKVK